MCIALCAFAEQRRLRECMELDVLHPPYHHRLLFHAQPGAGCVVRVSVPNWIPFFFSLTKTVKIYYRTFIPILQPDLIKEVEAEWR